MRNSSIVHFTNLRLAGAPIYNPKTATRSAFTELPVYDNSLAYTDAAGVHHKAPVQYLTAWNRKNLEAGKCGLADLMTRLSAGSEFSCVCHMDVYDSRIKDPHTGAFIVDSQGNEITVRRNKLVIIGGSIVFGREAQKVIDAEIDAGIRGEGWDGKLRPRTPEEVAKVTADMARYQQTLADRNSALYDGVSPMYNYAKVKAPAQNAHAGVQMGQAVQPGNAVPAPGVVAPQVGMTVEQLTAAAQNNAIAPAQTGQMPFQGVAVGAPIA